MSSLPNSSDPEALKKKFNEADSNQNGQLNIKEFKNFLESIGFDDKKMTKSILKSTDEDDDREVDFEEFVDFVEKYERVQEAIESNSDQFNKQFNKIDKDADGFISTTEMEEKFKSRGMGKKMIKSMKNGFELNDDKQIDFEEFKKIKALIKMKRAYRGKGRKHKKSSSEDSEDEDDVSNDDAE